MGKPKKIMVLCAGSRGDCQPYIAMCLELKSAGFEVSLGTNKDHVEFVKSHGINAYGMLCAAEQFMKENESMRKAMSKGDTIAFLKGIDDVTREYAAPNFLDSHAALTEVSPDLVIEGTLVEYFAAMATYRLGIPSFRVGLQQLDPNPKPMILGMPDLPCGLNSKLVKFILTGVHAPGIKNYDPVAKDKCGWTVCDTWTLDIWLEDYLAPPKQRPSYICQPTIVKSVVSPNTPSGVTWIGSVVITQDEQIKLSKLGTGKFGDAASMKAISDFLAAGEKPAYMGWGSMTCKTSEYMCELVVKAAKLSGARAIISSGWADLGLSVLQAATEDESLLTYAKEKILFVGNAPHEWLFPQCACAVHHGGSGTTNASLRSGAPTIITPVLLDQFDHARIVNELGIGVGFTKQFQKITAEELADAMKTCMSSPQIAKKAKEVSAEVCAQQGTLGVVDAVEKFWTNQVETGDFEQLVNERKQRRPKPWWACSGGICG